MEKKKTEKQRKKAQFKRQNEWQAENKERISVVLPKGTKEKIAKSGNTVNGLINILVKNYLDTLTD